MYEVRTGPLAVTVVERPGTSSARVCLVGEFAMGAEPALAGAVARLSRSQPDVVTLDLTAVTFVCSTFVHFVADVHAALPDASLLLHNPSPMARLVLAIIGLDTVLTGDREDEPSEPIYIRIRRPY